MKHWRIGLLGIVVSFLAIYFIVVQVDLQLLGESFRTARYIFVLPAAVLLVIALIPRAMRWRVLLGGALPVSRSFNMINVGYLVNGIVPLRIGELARMFLARRYNPPVPLLKSASTIIVERLLDLLAVLVLLGMALAASPTLPMDYRSAATGSVLLLLVSFSILIFFASQRKLAQTLVAWVTGWLTPLRKWNFQEWVDHFLDGLTPLTRPGLLIQLLLWTALGWGFSVFAGYILMFTFFESASLPATCLYIAAAGFAISVPAVPGNIGTYEWAIMLALSAMGYGDPATSSIVSFAVVVHGLNLAVHSATGVYGLIREGVSLNQLTEGVREINQPHETNYVEQPEQVIR